MRILRYSVARMRYYKKQTLFSCLFTSVTAFLLMLVCNLYHLQSTLYAQIEDRLSFLDTTSLKVHFPSFLSVKQFYVELILLLLFLFVGAFIFFFQRTLKQDQRELINWRLAGLSKTRIFLLIIWQMILPLLICCTLLFIGIVLFQNIYQALLQHLNFWSLRLFELPDTHSLIYRWINKLFLKLILKTMLFSSIRLRVSYKRLAFLSPSVYALVSYNLRFSINV